MDCSVQPRQPIDDIMALLLHGVQPAESPGAKQSAQGAEREFSSPRQNDCPTSPGLSEGPRRSLSSSPGLLLLYTLYKAMGYSGLLSLSSTADKALQMCMGKVFVCNDIFTCS